MGTSAAAKAKQAGKPMEPTGELAAIFQVKKGHEKQLRALIERIEREPLAQPQSAESATGRLHEPRFRLLDNDARLLFNTGCDAWDPCVGDLLRRNAAVCSALFVHLEGAPEKGINDPTVKNWILANQVTAIEDLGFPTASAATVTKKTGIERALEVVERVGNKVPHPAVIFILLIAVVIVLSHLFYLMGASATYESINPDTHQAEEVTTKVQSLLKADGIRFMYADLVRNFMSFTAVGVIIVAMLGVGVAETAGLIKALIRKLVQVAPAKALTYILVFVGILSSIAADAGYLVLIPLAAAAFLSVGRNPLVGLAASFAGVSAVFSVNILIKPLDGILTGITNDAIHLMNPNLSTTLTANFWFSTASVLMLTVVCGLITDKWIEPRLGPYKPTEAMEAVEVDTAGADESRGLKYATWGTLAILALFALLALPSWAPLRNPQSGALIGDSPFMNGLIVFIALAFLVAGAAYGIGAKTMKGSADVIKAMEKAVIGLGGLIFLLFFISQFIALFTYTNMATVAAVKAGDALETAGLGPLPLLVGFVMVVTVLNLLITGIIPKWAIFAPVFVPLLMRLHVPPEATLAAYRVGDSPTNAITPMMAYFPLIVGFAAKYQKGAGVGTVIAMMLPYVIIIQVVWMLLLIAWQVLGLPWGF